MEAESRLFPRGFPTGLSHVPPWCDSILGVTVEAVQGNQNWGTQKDFCAQEAHRVLLGFTLCVPATAEITYVSFAFVLNSY